jgi:hypothetical protein
MPGLPLAVGATGGIFTVPAGALAVSGTVFVVVAGVGTTTVPAGFTPGFAVEVGAVAAPAPAPAAAAPPAVVAGEGPVPVPPVAGASCVSGFAVATVAVDSVPGVAVPGTDAVAPVDGSVAPVAPVGAVVVVTTAVGSVPVCGGTWFTPALHVQPSKEARTPATDTKAKSGRSLRMVATE